MHDELESGSRRAPPTPAPTMKNFAREFVREYTFVLLEPEMLDSAAPPPGEEGLALGKQVEGLRAEFILGMLDAGRSSP